MDVPGTSTRPRRNWENVAADIADSLPGAEMVRQGLDDLAAGRTSQESLLVLIGAPRLRGLGFLIPDGGTAEGEHPEIQLYNRLSAEDPDAAHSRYNSFVRLLVSFERAVESGA